MNDVNRFTFYRNYYELIKHLPNKERLQMYDAISQYMFENTIPDLTGLCNGIWINLKMPLDTSKINIENGKKGGRPKNRNETEEKPKKNRNESEEKPKAKANNSFLFLISNFNFNNNINNLLEEYLDIRKKYKYPITERIINRLCKELNEYGKTDEEKEQIILNAINGAWKDFYKLKENATKKEPVWLNREQQQEIATEEEQQEMEDLLKNFRR